jgi:hypothetical protein
MEAGESATSWSPAPTDVTDETLTTQENYNKYLRQD